MSVRCDGVRHGFSLRCNGSRYRCVCGAEGCLQNKPNLCSAQAFNVAGKCLACGATGQYELLGADKVGLFSTLMHDENV